MQSIFFGSSWNCTIFCLFDTALSILAFGEFSMVGGWLVALFLVWTNFIFRLFNFCLWLSFLLFFVLPPFIPVIMSCEGGGGYLMFNAECLTFCCIKIILNNGVPEIPFFERKSNENKTGGKWNVWKHCRSPLISAETPLTNKPELTVLVQNYIRKVNRASIFS